MITKIIMHGVGSYKEKVEFDTNEKYIFIYGLNGSGKTLITRFLQDNDNGLFSKCHREGGDSEKILVYNQDFIENVFIEQYAPKDKGLVGIFTLESGDNGNTRQNLEEIERLKQENVNIKDKTTEDKEQKKKLEKDLKDLESAIEERLWDKIKKRYENSPFNYCLVKGSKKDNKEKLLNISFNNDTTQLSDLENTLKQFKDLEQMEVNGIHLIQSDKFAQIEKDEIFIKKIVGSQGSTIADVINRLGNSDWVKQGKEFLGDDDICPFCQKETIDNDFKQQLEEYFNESYKNDIQKLQNNLTDYQNYFNNIPQDSIFLEHYFIKTNKEKELEFKNLYNALKEGISKNIESIREKIKEPSRSISLQDTENLCNNLNQFLQKIQDDIEKYKQDLRQKEQKQEEIKASFWQIMRNELEEDIGEYKNNKEKWQKERANIQNQIEQKEKIIQENNQKIIDLQSEMLNIENTINAINNILQEMGIDDFSIKKHNENFYCIARKNEAKIEFKTLSEGEKTIISFLYFLQLCKGKENSNEEIHDKIVVIDDPISSLSHNHLFSISQLINQNYFKQQNSDIKQIFILTHNLYFFHEIIRLMANHPKEEPKETKLYRLAKYATSEIEIIKRMDIASEYESYWYIVRECQKDLNDREKYRHILPNVMRNILEHFFAFVDNEKYSKALQEQSFQCQAFIRYLNRESHSDSINITDFKEMDISKLLGDFKVIFEKTGNVRHYERYMRE
ncbi:hypothetical protein HPU229334_01755 [Helicobacter pullorum]|uniref:Protein CR006 P-loop domain-containing protein n=1 Tax=Helicobacter pullorum TaxID=35818 RepID=A0A0N0LTX8_9HELI|nr:AAA family ATPase [Helicobacter pullorum]KPH56468.1 hypothetical protein HPU229334_01755 [Helicobacter pullorum]